MESNGEIVRLQGDVNYTKLFSESGKMVKYSSYTLKKVLENYSDFIRISRSDAVKASNIKWVSENLGVIVLVDNTTIHVPRRRFKHLREHIDERKFL